MNPATSKPNVILGEPTSGATAAGWHSIEAFLRCPKEYQLAHIRKIKAPQVQTPDALALGLMFHAGRARWFSLRFAQGAKDWAKVVQAVQEATSDSNLPVSKSAERQALFLLESYADFYSKRPAPDPVAAEYDIPPSPIRKGDPFFLYRTARLDDVSRYSEAGGKLCIGESKTTSTTLNDTLSQYELHGQTMLQMLLWKHSPSGEAKHGPAAGVLLDVVKKPYGTEKPAFGRFFVPISDHQLEWYAKSLAGYLRAAAGIHWSADAPRNVSACTRLIGRMRAPCPFRDLCRFGRGAASKYVYGPEAKALVDWHPKEGEEVAPWE